MRIGRLMYRKRPPFRVGVARDRVAAVPDDASLARETIGRVIRRLIPFIFICYVVAYVDRVNIGFAARELQRDLGLTEAVFGLGGGLFFLGYCLFEIPSNLILERVGARRWIARIMVVWGLVSMGMVFVTGTASFYAVRVLLGLAEAGFFPGIVLYLTYWIPASERARAGALFMIASPIAMIVGAPLSEALLSLDGVAGLRGWHWLFILEGFPAVVLGFVAWRYLTDRPEQAEWLTPAQRAWLTTTMAREREARAARQHASELRMLLSGRLWLLTAIYFLNNIVTYGVFIWVPNIMRDVSGFRGWRLSLVTAIPFVAALVGMVVIGRHSDRTGDRKWHVAACAFTAAVGLVLAAYSQHSIVLIVLSFMLSQAGQRAIMGVFWAIPPIFLGGMAAAAGIALINALGNLGGFVGPTAIGWLRQSSGDYTSGLLLLAGVLVVEGILVASLRVPAERPLAAKSGSVA
jgi:ACS family tartrate transporter-like MFS transporter